MTYVLNFNSGSEVLSPGEGIHRQKRPERPNNRIRFFNDCDYINVPTNSDGHYANMQYLRDLQNNVNKKITFTPGPTNVDYMFDYNTGKRLVEYDTCRNNHTNSKYYLNEDDFLVLHLYDKNKVMPWFGRKITVFKRNNAIHYFKTHSGSKVFHFSGKDVKFDYDDFAFCFGANSVLSFLKPGVQEISSSLIHFDDIVI